MQEYRETRASKCNHRKIHLEKTVYKECGKNTNDTTFRMYDILFVWAPPFPEMASQTVTLYVPPPHGECDVIQHNIMISRSCRIYWLFFGICKSSQKLENSTCCSKLQERSKRSLFQLWSYVCLVLLKNMPVFNRRTLHFSGFFGGILWNTASTPFLSHQKLY